jgi:hypothetical protein
MGNRHFYFEHKFKFQKLIIFCLQIESEFEEEEASEAPQAEEAVVRSADAQFRLPVTSWVRKRRKAPTPASRKPDQKRQCVRENEIPRCHQNPTVVLQRITAAELVSNM